MSSEDLTPLPRGDSDPLVQALLRAGQRDRAPAGSEQRMLAFLGVAGGAGLLAPVAWLTARLGTKGLLVATVVAAGAIGGGLWALGGPTTPSPVMTTLPAPPVIPAAAVPPPPREPDVPTTRIEDLPSSAAVSDAAPPRPAAAPTPAEPPSLAHEVALVEAARAALARGDTGAALRALDTHDRESPNGTLMPESRALRDKALQHAP